MVYALTGHDGAVRKRLKNYIHFTVLWVLTLYLYVNLNMSAIKVKLSGLPVFPGSRFERWNPMDQDDKRFPLNPSNKRFLVSQDDADFFEKNKRFLETFDYDDSADYKSALSGIALKWAQENLPGEEYARIHESKVKSTRKVLIFVFVCMLPVMAAFLAMMELRPFSKLALKYETDHLPQNATQRVTATKGYFGTFYWESNGKRHEYAFEEFGLSPRENLTVYTDDDGNIIDVKRGISVNDILEFEMFAGAIGGIFVPAMLVLIYKVYLMRTLGKPWEQFYKDWEKTRYQVQKEAELRVRDIQSRAIRDESGDVS